MLEIERISINEEIEVDGKQYEIHMNKLCLGEKIYASQIKNDFNVDIDTAYKILLELEKRGYLEMTVQPIHGECNTLAENIVLFTVLGKE